MSVIPLCRPHFGWNVLPISTLRDIRYSVLNLLRWVSDVMIKHCRVWGPQISLIVGHWRDRNSYRLNRCIIVIVEFPYRLLHRGAMLNPMQCIEIEFDALQHNKEIAETILRHSEISSIQDLIYNLISTLAEDFLNPTLRIAIVLCQNAPHILNDDCFWRKQVYELYKLEKQAIAWVLYLVRSISIGRREPLAWWAANNNINVGNWKLLLDLIFPHLKKVTTNGFGTREVKGICFNRRWIKVYTTKNLIASQIKTFRQASTSTEEVYASEILFPLFSHLLISISFFVSTPIISPMSHFNS